MDYGVSAIVVTIGHKNLLKGNRHFYLQNAIYLFPSDTFWTKEKPAKNTIKVTYKPGGTSNTEIDEKHKFFRKRGPISEFFDKAGIIAGDQIIIHRIGEYEVLVEKFK